jgi:hypothetical protein
MSLKTFLTNWVLPPGFARLLVAAPSNIKRFWGGSSHGFSPPISLVPTGVTPASLRDLQIATHGEVVWVPVEKVRVWGRGLSPEQNQFVRYFAEGLPSLRRFYELHQPTNQMEANFLDPEKSGKFIPVRYPNLRNPWSFQTQYQGEAGLDAHHGIQSFGPISEKKLAFEQKRLDSIRTQVQNRGFLKLSDRDFIFFSFLLIRDDEPQVLDYRVSVRWGFHRTSLLASLGWPIIPMMAFPNQPLREVRLSQASEWPGVLDGTFSLEAARAYFLSQFRDPTEVLIPEW